MKTKDILRAVEDAGMEAFQIASKREFSNAPACSFIESLAVSKLAKEFGSDIRECQYTRECIRKMMDMLREFDRVHW